MKEYLMSRVLHKFGFEWPTEGWAVAKRNQRISLCKKTYEIQVNPHEKLDVITFKEGEIYQTGYNIRDSHWDIICDKQEFKEYVNEILSSAPEGATHFDPFAGAFIKYINDSEAYYWAIRKKGKWLKTFNFVDSVTDINDLIPMPNKPKIIIGDMPEQLKEGTTPKHTPEFGEECLFKNNLHHEGYDWCIFRGIMSDGNYIIEFKDSDGLVCGSFDPKLTSFRKKLTEIDELSNIIESTKMFSSTVIAREILKAGFKKK